MAERNGRLGLAYGNASVRIYGKIDTCGRSAGGRYKSDNDFFYR